jgi:O-antigen ligase
MLWLAYSWQVVANREHRPEILLIVSIIILGIVNASCSDSVANSLDPMRTFLLTGIFALWASLFLLADHHRRQVFDWFCAGALAIIVLGELTNWLIGGNQGPGGFQVFTLHPIPLGTLLILLSPGPVRLIVAKNPGVKLLGWVLVLVAGSLIFVTHKRGSWLALGAMLVVWTMYLVRRHRYLILAILLLVALILPLEARRQVARLDPNIPRHVSVLHRLELYNFALHVWQIHPVMGIGLRSFTQAQYLRDYQPRNRDLQNFPQAVATLQTFDNMPITALVELGSLMTLCYVGLVLWIVVRYVRILWSAPESCPLGWYRWLVCLGFAVHSLSYDSLLFPSVNWLFHVQLGIMAGYQASDASRLPGT